MATRFLDFWLIHQHQFNGPINPITIEISKECSIFSLYNLIQSLRERHKGGDLIIKKLSLHIIFNCNINHQFTGQFLIPCSQPGKPCGSLLHVMGGSRRD